ncbi:MAG: hypothetical protein LBT11_04025 [Treponema sp.]|jgi:hypothetical protein|nr:hypothetical protein [Treponema sp.]
MSSLLTVFIALSVFGLGITAIDFLGILDHSGDADGDASGGDSAEDGGGDGDTAGDGDDSGDAGDGDDSGAAGSGDDSGAASPGSHDAVSYLGPALRERRSEVGGRGIRAVTGLLGVLRFLVYFALGAGPAGVFALLTGHSRTESLLWSGGIGLGIAVLARLLRRLFRRNLDSSIKPEEFLMEKALLLVPMEPGSLGKAVIRQYGREQEIYVKCSDTALALPKGTELRIVNYDESTYYVEPINDSDT